MRNWRQGRRLLVHGRDAPLADAGCACRGLPVPVVPSCGACAYDGPSGMKGPPLRCVAALAALIALGAPAAGAPDNPILGTWEIAEVTAAPWSAPEQRPALEAQARRDLHTEVTFASGSVASKFKPFNCKRRVLYETNSIAVDALFQGNLPEPNPTAAATRLGFSKGDIPGIDVRCLKALFTFHFRDADTAMINLNRVIYTLKRR
jgi:hypothetical protein